jgi:peptidoglycan-associated lipoprotein
MISFLERKSGVAMARFAVGLCLIGIAMISLLACGGSKQVAQTEAEEPEVAQPEPPPPREEVVTAAPVEKAAPAPLVLQTVNFDYDKYDLTSVAMDILSINARGLREHPETQVLIEGHCDERGTVEYNLALGDKRAKAVKDYLVGLGIDGSRLSTITYGKERPLDTGRNEAAWAKNRRAEFVRK